MAAHECAAVLRSSGAVCGAHKAHPIHSRTSGHPDAHKHLDASAAGLKPMSDSMRNYREESGYNAAAKAARGNPCQIVSPVCTGSAEHLHESYPRGRAGGLKASLESGAPVFEACDACNGWIMENQVWARERGFIVDRPASVPSPLGAGE